MQSHSLAKTPMEAEKKHYELLVPLQFTRKMQEQIDRLDIHIIERIGSRNLKTPVGPDLMDTVGSIYLVYCTPEQAESASKLPFVQSIQGYQKKYPRDEIQSILEMNISLSIQFFCTISEMLEGRLKKYMRLAEQASYNAKRGLNNLGIFSISVNKVDDIKMIDEIAKIEEVRSVEYSSRPGLLKS